MKRKMMDEEEREERLRLQGIVLGGLYESLKQRSSLLKEEKDTIELVNY